LRTAGDILSAFLDKETLERAEQMGKLFSPNVWSDILTACKLPQGASHSRIAELEKTVLLIEADHPGWVQLLQTKQSDLLDTARRRFPEITFTGISFKLMKK